MVVRRHRIGVRDDESLSLAEKTRGKEEKEKKRIDSVSLLSREPNVNPIGKVLVAVLDLRIGAV